MRTKIEEIVAAAVASPEAAKVCSERILAVIREAAERLREKFRGEMTRLGGAMTKMYVQGKCNAMCDMLDLVDGKLGIDLKQPEPKVHVCDICGNCGYFMRYVTPEGDPDSYGDCGSIGMNKECYEGVNPFEDDGTPILQVDENERACGFFKLNRTRRIRKYIKDHPDLYKQ